MEERESGSRIGQFAVLFVDAIILGTAFIFALLGRKPERHTIAEEFRRIVPRWVRGGMLLSVGVLLAFGVVVFGRYYNPPAPGQPIPFSHRLHVSRKGLNCFFCHPYATRSRYAGMPPVQKCLLCHSVIATRFWPIARISKYDMEKKGIPWVRVYRIPDFAHFSHQPHLARGFDCGVCHGNVAGMDRVRQVQRTDMNFCVTCHWRNDASVDCFTCHY